MTLISIPQVATIQKQYDNKDVKNEGYKSDNKAVLWSVVFVLILVDQSDPGPVICFSLCKHFQDKVQ